ncbi:MAG: HIT domain-containing protein [Amphiplicatus sp.]
MTYFVLDPRLAAETFRLGSLDLCEALLMNETRFAWLILVPRRMGLAELYELTRPDRELLVEEIAVVSEALARYASACKMNVAALGNHVAQLHVHVIARREDDEAWPNPVWGAGVRRPYPEGDGESVAAALARALHIAPNANTL